MCNDSILNVTFTVKVLLFFGTENLPLVLFSAIILSQKSAISAAQFLLNIRFNINILITSNFLRFMSLYTNSVLLCVQIKMKLRGNNKELTLRHRIFMNLSMN